MHQTNSLTGMEQTFVNPLCLPDYPLSPRMRGGPFAPDTSRPFGNMVARGLPPTHQHLAVLFGARANLQAENDTRSSADPVGLYYEGMWYLYATGSACWSSPDFVHWTAHETGARYTAPDIAVRRGTFYLAGNSTELYTAGSPTGPFTPMGHFTWQGERLTPRNDDVSIFVDDDERMYLYWGMGPGIWGAELNPAHPTELLTEPKNLILFDANHWWERCGQHNQDWSNGFPEGSNMIKVNGTYYLQYSVCGTEYDTYCMGCYKSNEGPLSGFRLQGHNPIARKTTGLYRGIGHAAVCRGPGDTLWMFETVLIGVDGDLERRLACDPAGIDANGDLYVAHYYEQPQFVPGVVAHPELANGSNLDNLTQRHSVWASSHAPGRSAVYGLDGNIMTWWQPAEGDAAPQLAVGLRADYNIYGARVLFKEVGSGIRKAPFGYRIEVYSGEAPNDEPWTVLVNRSGNDEDYIFCYDRLDKPVQARYARLILTRWPEGLQPGVIDFSLFGMHALKPHSGEALNPAAPVTERI